MIVKKVIIFNSILGSNILKAATNILDPTNIQRLLEIHLFSTLKVVTLEEMSFFNLQELNEKS